jgi:hypothetical protein
MLFWHALLARSSYFLTVHRALHALASRDPADVVLRWLREEFAAGRAEDGFSLAIDAGRGGARLTHSHTRQARPVGVKTEIAPRCLAKSVLCDGEVEFPLVPRCGKCKARALRQFRFVEQSLMLWREVLSNMYIPLPHSSPTVSPTARRVPHPMFVA